MLDQQNVAVFFCCSLLLEDSNLIHLILRVALGARGIKRTVSWWVWDLKANYQAINCVVGNQWLWDLGLNLTDPTWRAQSGVPFPANLNVTPPAFCLTREGRRGLVVIWNLLGCENSWLFCFWSDWLTTFNQSPSNLSLWLFCHLKSIPVRSEPSLGMCPFSVSPLDWIHLEFWKFCILHLGPALLNGCRCEKLPQF